LPDDRLDGAIENVHETLWVFAMRVATHRRFIDRDLAATGSDERFEFRAHDRQQRFSERVSVAVSLIRNEPAAERVWAGHAGLQSDLRFEI
jgi:hypothetical protein